MEVNIMEKFIEAFWYNRYDEEQSCEAVVEYTEICDDENGEIVTERDVINVFLPEDVPAEQKPDVRKQVVHDFYNFY
jgi:hypothetical protein